jgi:hypothetical protein
MKYALLLLLAIPGIVAAECIEYRIVDHGDHVEAVCIGKPLTPEEKRKQEKERQDQWQEEQRQLKQREQAVADAMKQNPVPQADQKRDKDPKERQAKENKPPARNDGRGMKVINFDEQKPDSLRTMPAR